MVNLAVFIDSKKSTNNHSYYCGLKPKTVFTGVYVREDWKILES